MQGIAPATHAVVTTLLVEVEDFGKALVNLSHEYCREFGERAFCKAVIVNRAKFGESCLKRPTRWRQTRD
jgi:hypothetical protein